MSPILGIMASSISGSKAVTNSYESIATVTAAGGESTLSFSSISSVYKHLQIRGIHRVSGSFYTGDVFMRVGAGSIDSGNNYSNHIIVGDGTSAAAAGGGSRSSVMGFDYYNSVGNLATTGMFAACVIDLLDYANTNKYKTMRFLEGREINRNDTDSRVYFESGLWQSLSAISNIQFSCLTGAGAAGTFIAGTTFALYGIKG
jgi:hypothetical protein